MKNVRLFRFLIKIIKFILVYTLCSCTTVIAGKKASANGTVLLGHNEDGAIQMTSFNRVPRIEHKEDEMVVLNTGGKLPQVITTWSYLWSQAPGQLFCDFYINEWNVAVSSNGAPSKEDNISALIEAGQINDGGIDYWLRRLVAERAVNAKHGLDIAISLIERFGYNSSGRIYEIIDPEEAWILHVIAGKNYYAKKLDDHEVTVIPNNYIIKEIDLSGKSGDIASPGLKEYAQKRGWHNSNDFSFLFENVFGVEGRGALSEEGYDLRQWIGQRIINKMNRTSAILPFSVKPNRPVSLAHMKQLLRSHFKDVPNDMINNEKGNPHFFKKRCICYNNTKESIIVEFRKNKASGQDCLIWRALGCPCLSIYVPIYNGISVVPDGYRIFEQDKALEKQFDPEALSPLNDTLIERQYLKKGDKARYKNPMKDFYLLQERANENYKELSEKIYENINFFEAYISEKLSAFEERLKTETDRMEKNDTEVLSTYINDNLTNFASEISEETWDWVENLNNEISGKSEKLQVQEKIQRTQNRIYENIVLNELKNS